MFKRIVFLSIGLIILNAQLFAQVPENYDADQNRWVDSVMKKLSLDEQIAQLFMVAAYSNKDQDHIDDIAQLVEKNKIGGLIFFQGGPVRQAKLTNYYQSISEIPLLIAIDGEWGLGMRLDSTFKYPKQMMLGAIENDSLIYQMGRDIGFQLKRLGIHINFAPVVDINNNPLNPVINARSFGENKENVTNKGIAYMKGMQDIGIMAVAKHFPGHGDTDKDSHYTLPAVYHSKERLDSVELYPFKKLIDAGVQGVMVAHLNVPALEKTPELPTTLSKAVITDLLKNELGFKGLVFTDALNMKGVSESNTPGEIECMALAAGNDILLFSENVAKAIARIKKLVKQDKISRDQIEISCRKVLAAKYKAGLNNYLRQNDYVKIAGLEKDLNRFKFDLTRRNLVESGLTLIKNERSLLPITKLKNKKIASVSFGTDKITTFQKTLDKYAKVDHFCYQNGLSDSLIRIFSKYDLVITSIYSSSLYPSGNNYGVKDEYLKSIIRLSASSKVVFTLFANPFSLKALTAQNKIAAILVAYENDEINQSIAAQAIFGGIIVSGKLPITINNDFPVGLGIELKKKIRLKYSIPEAAGIDSEELYKADSIALKAIDDRATPGCRILAARNGIVFYDKSFGYHDYFNEIPVTDNSIYDIASITKIVATVPALMRLYEQHQLNIDDSLKRYFPDLDTTNKGNLLISDILTHQAQLNGWIPFYLSTLQTLYPEQNLTGKKFSEEYPYKVNDNLYLSRNYVFRDSIYSYIKSSKYSIPVTENLYIKSSFADTIFRMIDRSKLIDKKEYRYSDLGYYYFYKLIENSTRANFADYIDTTFYASLGAYRTSYLPLQKFNKNEIVPTENDQVFRRQLIHGTVHDPGAAMLGGVCGHAGVFATADDLAKIMQLFLNGGEYGDESYFAAETINYFTRYQGNVKENRRAFGFDKPEPDTLKIGPACKSASPLSFGHSGFTGTMVWADPAEQLVYIFLSNRVYPDQDNNKLLKMNVRTDVQQIIYDAIIR
ncbi:MAG: glycoside hydrolase family 3 N-terminal domain-containing protein [Bacteroidales bacterium]